MALLEPLYRIAEICSHFGVENAIICPGSRSAALTLAFTRNKKIGTRVITDERSAAFVALGMAQVTHKPVVLICTSGTAALNFSPAVAEAYFQRIPLLILTADRPPEWINQHDGQTIYQREIYGKHIVKSFELPVDYSEADSVWHVERQTNEALGFCVKGPVHINIPIREPFYPEAMEKFSGNFRRVNFVPTIKSLREDTWNRLLPVWNAAGRITIAIGQNHEYLDEWLEILNKDSRVSVWTDVISNVNITNPICSQDTFLSHYQESAPALLITFGKSFISKSFKQYFRKNKPEVHWHVEDQTELIDPLQSITDKIPVGAGDFLASLTERVELKIGSKTSEVYDAEEKSSGYLQEFIKQNDFGELKAVYQIFKNLRNKDLLHLGNSMPVRYANLLNRFLPAGVRVYANRGTSGIDGIVSTAIGHALVSETPVHCFVGDVSFFYDSNALFSARPGNIRIYLLNNGGGNIFRIIDGPGRQDELETHFITNPNRTAKNLSEEAGYIYNAIHTEEDLEAALKQKEDGGAALFEIFLDGVKDSLLFKKLKAGFIL